MNLITCCKQYKIKKMINKLIKKLFAIIAVLAIALTMALNLNFSAKNNNLSDIYWANVEALAQNEGDDPVWYVYYINNGYHGSYPEYYYLEYKMCADGGSDKCIE